MAVYRLPVGSRVAGSDRFVNAAMLRVDAGPREQADNRQVQARLHNAVERRQAVAEAVAEFNATLPIYTLARGEMADAARELGLRVVPEFFADRPLRDDGSVVMFRWWERFEATPATVAERVVSLVTRGCVPSLEGIDVPVMADTVCVHSDTPGAAEIGPAVRAALEGAGISITADLTAGEE